MELASDDLVPLMIMTIIQSSLTDLVSTTDYISEFDFTQLKERELGYPHFSFPHHRFCFSSFQVATEFLLAKAREHALPCHCTTITPHVVLLNSPTACSQLFPVHQQFHHSGSFNTTRRNSIAFNPDCQVYHEKDTSPHSVCTPNTHTTPIDLSSSSVFSDLLHSYFHTGDSPLPLEADTPQSEGKYWWNAHGSGRGWKYGRKGKKFSLPWNYPMKKEVKEDVVVPELNVPRMEESQPSQEVKEDIPKKKKKWFCCCWGEDEDETPLLQTPSTPIFPPVSLRPEAAKAYSVPSTPLRSNKMRDQSIVFSSKTLPTSSSLLCFSRESEGLNTVREMRRPSLSADEGMGSFIQGLKNSCEPVISSRDWSLSHNDSATSE